MTEFVFSPPNTILFIAGGIAVVAGASIFLKKGERSRKIIALAVVAVVVIVLVVMGSRPVTLTLSRDGLVTSGLNPIELSWADVRSTELEQNLPESEYRPTIRTRGTALGSYRSGRFRLSNGDAARVLMVRNDKAVIIVTNELTYLFSPDDVDGLAAAIDPSWIGGE